MTVRLALQRVLASTAATAAVVALVLTASPSDASAARMWGAWFGPTSAAMGPGPKSIVPPYMDWIKRGQKCITGGPQQVLAPCIFIDTGGLMRIKGTNRFAKCPTDPATGRPLNEAGCQGLGFLWGSPRIHSPKFRLPPRVTKDTHFGVIARGDSDCTRKTQIYYKVTKFNPETREHDVYARGVGTLDRATWGPFASPLIKDVTAGRHYRVWLHAKIRNRFCAVVVTGVGFFHETVTAGPGGGAEAPAPVTPVPVAPTTDAPPPQDGGAIL